MTEPLGIYLHWPYCSRICPYCDFNVYKDKGADHGAWQEALLADLHYWHEKTRGRPLTSLYFGGGTPSLMPPALAGKIVETCAALWGFVPAPEITLEANPTDAEADRFSDFATAGINRLSLGVQSLRDEALRFLGRNHDADEARRAISLALDTFPRMSLDLIYALPDQTLAVWQTELEETIGLGLTHLSLYQLTIEPGTAFSKAATRGDWQPPQDDLQAAFYDLTQEICERHGLAAYEVSNHASPGEASRHNHLYWHYHDYIGIGPGAHGRVTCGGQKIITEGVRKPASYLAGEPQTRYTQETISSQDQGTEYLAMALRLKEGLSLERFEALSGGPLPEEKLGALEQAQLLTRQTGRIALTDQGRKVLNQIVLELIS